MNRVKEIRKERGLTQENLSEKVNISRRYLSMIERQKVNPSIDVALKIADSLNVSVDKLFINTENMLNTGLPEKIKYIDLFCGIGGFRFAINEAMKNLNISSDCVFSSDIDKYAQDSYEANFGERPIGDIKKVNEKDIPDFDILLAGFPCQAFSICGLQQGFEDTTRGTLFFDIARIIKEKKPKAFVLENVKNLASHDHGNTLKTILDILRNELGYHVDYKVLNA